MAGLRPRGSVLGRPSLGRFTFEGRGDQLYCSELVAAQPQHDGRGGDIDQGRHGNARFYAVDDGRNSVKNLVGEFADCGASICHDLVTKRMAWRTRRVRSGSTPGLIPANLKTDARPISVSD